MKFSAYRSLPLKDGTSSKELDEAEKPDSSVQTYVDEKGRTRVSRVRGMGVRMTRDLQWNLYLMKDVEKRQALGEPKDDNESAYAESLVNNGDGELFQRLMIGDNASVSESLSGVPSKAHGEPVQSLSVAPLEANQSMHGGSHNDSAVGAGQKAVVNSGVMPQLSGIQITFNSNEYADDEDLDMFKSLVTDEAATPLDKPQELKPSSAPAAIAEGNEDDECEWEDGDCQGAKEVDLGLKGSNRVEEFDQQNRSHTEPYNLNPTRDNLSYAGDSDAELALAIQESLAEHDRLRASQPGVYPDSEDTGLSDDSDTGDSGESEVEWEDGSGAVAVPAVGYTVTGPCPLAATKALLYSNSSGCVGEIFANPHASSIISRFYSEVVAPSLFFIICTVSFVIAFVFLRHSHCLFVFFWQCINGRPF